jgi:hypothetical protein
VLQQQDKHELKLQQRQQQLLEQQLQQQLLEQQMLHQQRQMASQRQQQQPQVRYYTQNDESEMDIESENTASEIKTNEDELDEVESQEPTIIEASKKISIKKSVLFYYYLLHVISVGTRSDCFLSFKVFF